MQRNALSAASIRSSNRAPAKPSFATTVSPGSNGPNTIEGGPLLPNVWQQAGNPRILWRWECRDRHLLFLWRDISRRRGTYQTSPRAWQMMRDVPFSFD